jgi:hypothetical protein
MTFLASAALDTVESFENMSISPIPGGIHRQMGKKRGA